MTLLITYLLIALFFSFLCSLLEAVILSITPTYIGIKIHEGNKLGTDLQKLKDKIDRPLAAILTLNTFAHTIGAAGVGAQAQNLWGNEYLSIVSIILTILILILSEIIPKTLGANYWKEFAGFANSTLKILIIILYPFVIISQYVTKLLQKKKEKSVDRADFKALTEIGFKEGVIKKGESRIIQNLLRFHSILVKDIMTPRTVLVAAEENKTIKEFYSNEENLRFARIPIYNKVIDDISGFILKDELLIKIINNESEEPLKVIKRSIQAVYDHLPIPELFTYLMEKNEHIAVVVDEYGGVQGVVTIEDVVETLLGMEIMDELDSIEDMQLYARRTWEKRAKKLGLIK